MLTPLTERQQTLIVNNVVRACEDINALNKTGYNFLYLCQGFIAHYSIHGFKSVYASDGHRSLICDIVRNYDANQWRNFCPGKRDYDYYMSKAAVYRRIMARIVPDDGE